MLTGGWFSATVLFKCVRSFNKIAMILFDEQHKTGFRVYLISCCLSWYPYWFKFLNLFFIFVFRALWAPLVPRRTVQRFGISLYSDQSQDGPASRKSRLHHRPQQGAAFLPLTQRAYNVGWPLRSVLSYRGGWVHMCTVWVRTAAGDSSKLCGQLQRETANQSLEPVQILHCDDRVRLMSLYGWHMSCVVFFFLRLFVMTDEFGYILIQCLILTTVKICTFFFYIHFN